MAQQERLVDGYGGREQGVHGSIPSLVLLAIFLGSGYAWIRFALRSFSSIDIAFLQVVIGASVLYAFLAARGCVARLNRDEWLHLSVLALFANVIPSLLVAWAERIVGPGVAGVTNATTPLFVLALAATLGAEALDRTRVMGLALGFGGVIVLGAPWSSHNGSLLRLSGLLIAAASYAVAYFYAGRVLRRMHRAPTLLAAAQLLSATAILLPVALVANATATNPRLITGVRADALAGLLGLGVFTIGIGYALNYRTLLSLGAVRTSVVTYLIPVVSVGLGVVLAGEQITWNLFAGGGIVVLGVALTELHGSTARRPSGAIDHPESNNETVGVSA